MSQAARQPEQLIRPKLLIVEDDEGLQTQLKWAYDDYEVLQAFNREEAITLLRSEEPAVVTLDLGLPPDPDGTSEGFATLEEIIALKPDTKVIVASGHGARQSALDAIAKGAYDFYQKPVDIDELGHIVSRAFHLHEIEEENARLADASGDSEKVLGRIITAAPEMLKVARTIERVAPTNASVMLLGASGTGKELLARGLHDHSDRKANAFIAINCAAIPENLLEAELFGHEKGAFTGAIKTTEGKIEQAHGGTLFLDEVGDIPLPLQVKLLRFLQERVIERIGGRKPIAVDTRIVCATHQDVEQMQRDGTFREDLYYRLAEIVVTIPTLAERPGDTVLLAKHFLNRMAEEFNPKVKGFAADALRRIDEWPWPGNVRELENRVKRAVIMADGKLVHAEDLDLGGDDEAEADSDSLLNIKAAREESDRKVIRRALARSEGNISNTARLLGISRPTLYDLLKQYDLQPGAATVSAKD
ncbi:MAG: PEP-CTERM-box response regulator transcription factor [Pseudomonadota bacterium]